MKVTSVYIYRAQVFLEHEMSLKIRVVSELQEASDFTKRICSDAPNVTSAPISLTLLHNLISY